MAEHAWTVLCQRTLEDSDSKLISLIDVFDKLILNPTPDLPDIKAKLAEARETGNKGVRFPAKIRLATQWFRSNGSKPEASKFRLSFIDPLGERLFEQEVPLELAEKTAQRIVLKAEEIHVTVPGVYYFVVEKPKEFKGKPARWLEVSRQPLEVVIGGLGEP